MRELKGNVPMNAFLVFTNCQSLAHPRGMDVTLAETVLNSTTNPLTATALIYALRAGITAGAGTRLVL